MTALPTDTEEPMLEVYKRASRTVERELQVQLEPVSGRVPEGLRGVLFRNGPGRNELFGVPYGHPFDGDGMITRFEFNDGGVRYRNRFVRTRELTEELRAGKPLYRSFGTNLPGGLSRNLARLRFKNAANTSVIDHGGHLLALWEGGWPHRLDPDSLETLGRFDYDGRLLNRNSWVDRVMAPELPFSAHPKFCSRTGEMVNFGMALGVKNRLMLYRVDPLGRMAPPTSHTLDALSFVHDFVMTERHLVFFLPAVAFNVPRTLAGFSTPVDSLTALDRPTRVLVLSREDFRIVGELNASPGFIFPFANAYERHGEFGVDGLQMPRLPDGDAIRDLLAGRDPEFPRAKLVRTRFSLGDALAQEERLYSLPLELPQIDSRYSGQKHSIVFAAGVPAERPDPFLTSVVRLDVESQTPKLRDFGRDLVGEPVFVPSAPDAPEGHGFLLMLSHSAEHDRAELWILDAESLDDLARFALPHTVPPGFHGTFVPHA